MWKRIALLLPWCLVTLSLAREKQENWLEVRSAHFTVMTDANEKAGRRIADQFERMRSVFHTAFPKMSIETSAPIVVLATKDDKDFRALEPAAYLAKGQLKLGGLFLRAPDKNYILMRVEAEGEHPYAVVYHEYTHLLLGKSADWLPLWLNEGLAQFYENTDIHEKDVALGQPSTESILLLRQSRLLPLTTLFTVDANSPYYHEENKGSIFYAESWALTHYLQVKDFQQKTHRVADYVQLLAEKIDPVTAASRAFGDLKVLQSDLENSIRQQRFDYFKIQTTTEVDSASFKVQALSASRVDAVRADFLAYNDRVSDAKPLLERVLQEDPRNALAHETMGFLEFRAGHMEEARKWYQQAAGLDSQSYIAHYYFAAMAMNEGANAADDAQIESSLRAAIKLNPAFAPTYERLAAFEGMRHKNLDEARMMALNATQLDPGNVSYRITGANVLLEMQRVTDAITVLRVALKLAKTPEETAMVQSALNGTEQYGRAQEQMAEQNRRMAEEIKADAQVSATPEANDGSAEPAEEEPPRGPHRFLLGTMKNVQCHSPSLELTLETKGKTVALHSGNFYKIAFTVLGYAPTQDLNPCTDLDGKVAKVEYVESSAKALSLVAIELHK
jgi:tetratricopeptide (TPR) repeat protein